MRVVPTFSTLLSSLYDQLKKHHPVSEEERVHLAEVSAWLAEGKKELENIRDMSSAEAEKALVNYYNRKPKRKAGRPNTNLPRPRKVRQALSERLVEVGLANMPEDRDKFLEEIAAKLIG